MVAEGSCSEGRSVWSGLSDRALPAGAHADGANGVSAAADVVVVDVRADNTVLGVVSFGVREDGGADCDDVARGIAGL